MENGYVGYWVMYQYEKGIGGVLTLGMNGSPVTPDFAVVKWTDTGDSALKGIKYMGFTSSNNAKIGYGVNCALVKTTPEEKFNQVEFQLPNPIQNHLFDSTCKGEEEIGNLDGRI
jgi:hypothetical protein